MFRARRYFNSGEQLIRWSFDLSGTHQVLAGKTITAASVAVYTVAGVASGLLVPSGVSISGPVVSYYLSDSALTEEKLEVRGTFTFSGSPAEIITERQTLRCRKRICDRFYYHVGDQDRRFEFDFRDRREVQDGAVITGTPLVRAYEDGVLSTKWTISGIALDSSAQRVQFVIDDNAVGGPEVGDLFEIRCDAESDGPETFVQFGQLKYIATASPDDTPRGLLFHTPAEIFKTLLVDLGLGTDSANGQWRVAFSNELDAPDDVITVYDTLGYKDGRMQYSGETDEHPGIQIRVRGATHASARSKILEIASVLDEGVSDEVVEVDEVGYQVGHFSRTGNVLSLGRDQNSNRRLFTLNGIASLTRLYS